ncbi:MAG: hypothetical protein WBP11_09180 [Dokdonella sp.]
MSAVAGFQRLDVGKWLHAVGYDYGGFYAYIDGSKLSAGTYRLKVSTESGALCDSGIDIAIERDADIRLAY